MQEKVGYQLINVADGSIFQSWGGIWGQCPGVPNPIILPNGDIVYCPVLDETYGEIKFAAWMMDQPAPTEQDVINERSRRLALGFNYDFGTPSAPNVQNIGTTPSDMAGWSEVTSWASAQIALNNTTSTLTILTNTGSVSVTGVQWMEVLNAASAFRQPLWTASFALEAMNPIPSDYTDDKWW